METNGISGLSAYRIFATETKTSTLSPMRYFNYQEFEDSATARRDGIDNSLTPVARRMVTILVEMLLYKIFGDSHIDDVLKRYGLLLLGRLPIDPNVAALCDAGKLEEIDKTNLESVELPQ